MARNRKGVTPPPPLREPDPETVRAVVTAVQAGTTLEGAAGYAGVGRATLYSWLRHGRRMPEGDPSLYRSLVDQVDNAFGSFEVQAVAAIRQHAGNSWQAWAWLLERKWPERYGRRLDVNATVTAQSDDPRIVALHEAGFQGDANQLTDEELETLITLLAKCVAPPDATNEMPVIEQSTNGEVAA